MHSPLRPVRAFAGCFATACAALAQGAQYRGPGELVPPTPTWIRQDLHNWHNWCGPDYEPPESRRIDDLSTWEFWWEIHKDVYLLAPPRTEEPDFDLGAGSRAPQHRRQPPSAAEVRGEIEPVLRQVIAVEQERDTVAASMLAIAKVHQGEVDASLRWLLLQRLQSRDAQLRIVAALSLGMLAQQDATLLGIAGSLVDDDAGGRELCPGGDEAVESDVRTKALFGLGVTAHRSRDMATKQFVFELASGCLAEGVSAGEALQVAAVMVLGVLAPDHADAAGCRLRDATLATLEQTYTAPATAPLARAHCLTALVQVAGPRTEVAARYRRQCADLLASSADGVTIDLQQSRAAAMALAGALRLEPDGVAVAAADQHLRDVLLATWREHPDLQTRFLAMVSLGRCGGQQLAEAIVEELAHAKGPARSWCALALGLCVRASADQPIELAVTELAAIRLEAEFAATREPHDAGALAVALGLARAKAAAPALRRTMVEQVRKEEMAGYCAIGLALLGDSSSKPELQLLFAKAPRRFTFLQQGILALGVLGDAGSAPRLRAQMSECEPHLAKLSAIARALGWSHDRRVAQSLRHQVLDKKLGVLTRAYAATALGCLGDPEPLPWNAIYTVNLPYRAAPLPLINGYSGILDFL